MEAEDTKKKVNKKQKNSYYLSKKVNLSENAVKVLERRYLKRDEKGVLLETPRDMFVRVARNVALAEGKYGRTEEEVGEIEKQFFDIMADLDFLPNSPTLMNAGKELQQLSACFVLPVGDSMTAIFEALKETALIQKSGGGVGYSFSNIRPKNDVVLSTKGVSSGPISFMTVFNAATDTIKQGGTRRGANMGILRVDHPDILDFITSKEDNEKLTNFNISVGVTEKFMKAVENDEEYEIVNPRTKEVVDKYKAKEVFSKIVENAWKSGDPGIVFLDRLNKDNPTPNMGQIESTNPCVSGKTLISTDRGFIKAGDLYEMIKAGENVSMLFDKRALEYKVSKEFSDKNLDIFKNENIKSWNRGKKDTYRLKTYSGYEIEATPEHKVLTTNGYKELIELKKDDEVLIQPLGKFVANRKIFSNGKVKELNSFTKRKILDLPEYWSCELGEILGWLIGDGWLRDDRVEFTFGHEDRELASYFNQIISRWYNYNVKEIIRENGVINLSYHSKGFVEFFKELGVKACTSRQKEVPESLMRAPKEASVGFLKGIFSSDGSIDDTDGTIKISSSSKKLLKGVQMLLLNLGIKSNILTRKYSFSKNFSYTNKEGEHKSYKAGDDNYFGLFISGGVSKKRFQKEAGFLLERKEKLLKSFKFEKLSSKNYYNEFIDRVEEVKYAGRKEVFDFNEPVSNSYIANGIVVRNCGEQPLLPYEACNLGSINLANMAKEEEGIKQVDYDRLKRIVHISVRFLDDVIDMSRYPLEKIEQMSRGNRKIGLGVMGYADLLIVLGIPYDSEEALELAQKIMSFIQDESKNASKELAKEKGVFPNFKGSVYDSPDGYEIRNVTTTTIAPTGTLSIIADCSSGVEPLFAISFVKNVMDNDKLVELNKYFKKIAIDEEFFSEDLMEKISEKGSLKDIEEVPKEYKRIFVTAHEISPKWHVRTQATFQKYVDNAVSKTVNFSSDATVQDVDASYMLAYRLGCKGITIFRDRSKGEQVLQVEGNGKGKIEKLKEPGSPGELKEGKLKPRPRPEVTYGMTKKYRIGNCGKLYVTINSDENGICEIFTNTGEEGCAALAEAVGRLISIAIRSGIDIESIKNQLEGIRCATCIADNNTHVLSCPDAIAKAVDFYLKGTNKFDLNAASGPRSLVVCPECGEIMEPEGGCYTCRSCGYSKCS
ncbi:MAG: ribonucleotide reductase N-terminal alpha domain-containing protein [Actinomycetota bacterium]|nr:ribonucleotide reductase N-terminal alpha domain-containing protein [Actinomycetota bacterium]